MGDVRLALEEVKLVSDQFHWLIPAFWRRALLYGALAGVPLLAGWFALNRSSEMEANSMPLPLTAFQGNATSAAWSPDGRQVAFTWDGVPQTQAAGTLKPALRGVFMRTARTKLHNETQDLRSV